MMVFDRSLQGYSGP
uniref:Uncharacterized protein n=1 Tax=Anguilla anguilla TaxID=7936 RepID=A0A0E9Q340_ANGAN